MSEKEKQRLFIFGGIALVILLLFLWRGKAAGAVNTVIQQSTGGEGFALPDIISPDITVNLPPLDYVPNTGGGVSYASSSGCALCAGISNNILTLPVMDKVSVPEEKQAVMAPAPAPYPAAPARAVSFSSGASSPTPWWSNCTVGRCF